MGGCPAMRRRECTPQMALFLQRFYNALFKYSNHHRTTLGESWPRNTGTLVMDMIKETLYQSVMYSLLITHWECLAEQD